MPEYMIGIQELILIVVIALILIAIYRRICRALRSPPKSDK